MNRDTEAKRMLLADWSREFLPAFSAPILGRGVLLTKEDVQPQLDRLLAGWSFGLSVYVLFARGEESLVPVYIGKAESPLRRWGQHLDGWCRGVDSYARWREALLDGDGQAQSDLVLLVVPASAISHAPKPGFPTTIGSVEYQLIDLADAAYPGCLLNSEGKGR